MGRKVKIGSICDEAEVIVKPSPGARGQIKTKDGAMAEIDYDTLQDLIWECERATSTE